MRLDRLFALLPPRRHLSVGSTGGEVSKGASGQDIALRFYRAVMLVSIVLIVLSVM